MPKNAASLYIGDLVDDLQKCSDYIAGIYGDIASLDDSDPLRSELVDKLEDAFDIVDDLKNALQLQDDMEMVG